MSKNHRERDVHALFVTAERERRVGIACKTKPVDARPAQADEVIITLIKDEGNETRSKAASGPSSTVSVQNRAIVRAK